MEFPTVDSRRVPPVVQAAFQTLCMSGLSLLFVTQGAVAQAPADATSNAQQVVTPGIVVLSEREGNLLVRIGSAESIVIGRQSPSLVRRARSLLAQRKAPPVRFAVAIGEQSDAAFGDGGWTAAGATVFAQENLRGRMERALSDTLVPRAPSALVPEIGFSEVVQIALSGREEAHVVHQPTGQGTTDVVVHLERENVLFLGDLFTNGQYPEFDVRGHGSYAGRLKAISGFVSGFGSIAAMRYVPARGPATTVEGLREYETMLSTVGSEVERLMKAGKTESEIIAARPSARFDSRWGNGTVSADAFVASVFRSLSKR